MKTMLPVMLKYQRNRLELYGSFVGLMVLSAEG